MAEAKRSHSIRYLTAKKIWLGAIGLLVAPFCFSQRSWIKVDSPVLIVNCTFFDVKTGVNLNSHHNNEEYKFIGKAINDRHPRTAIGYTRDERLIVLVIQGRFSGIAERADLVQEPACCRIWAAMRR